MISPYPYLSGGRRVAEVAEAPAVATLNSTMPGWLSKMKTQPRDSDTAKPKDTELLPTTRSTKDDLWHTTIKQSNRT
jgi:hypothetical protein